ESFIPAGTPRGSVVITHGYAEHCGRYREVANVIVQAGWAALTYDVRGHGKSPGPRGYIDRFEHYVDDLAAMRSAARPLAPEGAPQILVGHSHGALITLRGLVDEQPCTANAVVLASPYLALKLAVPAYKKLAARIASRIAPRFAQNNQLIVEDLTADRQKQAERLDDPLCFKVATARWFTEATDAQQYVEANAHRIDVPTVWLVGGADPIADPEHTRKVAATVRGASYHDLVGLKHEVFNELERSKVFLELTRALASA
ncbi:MAG: lysophospholipase, partial [Kofleriaceae bacterium]